MIAGEAVASAWMCNGIRAIRTRPLHHQTGVSENTWTTNFKGKVHRADQRTVQLQVQTLPCVIRPLLGFSPVTLGKGRKGATFEGRVDC